MFCQTCNNSNVNSLNQLSCACYGDEIRKLGKFMKSQKIKNIYFSQDLELKDTLVIITNKKKFYIGIQCSVYQTNIYPAITLDDSKIIPDKKFKLRKKTQLTDNDKGLFYVSPFHPSHRLLSKKSKLSINESTSNIKQIIGAYINHFSVKKDHLFNDVLVIKTTRNNYYITLRNTVSLYNGTYCPISTTHKKMKC